MHVRKKKQHKDTEKGKAELIRLADISNVFKRNISQYVLSSDLRELQAREKILNLKSDSNTKFQSLNNLYGESCEYN